MDGEVFLDVDLLPRRVVKLKIIYYLRQMIIFKFINSCRRKMTLLRVKKIDVSWLGSYAIMFLIVWGPI